MSITKEKKSKQSASVTKPLTGKLLSPGHTMCSGCGNAIAVNLLSKACPKNVIVSCATSCLEVTTSAYPMTSWNVPFIHCAFETTSSVASGIEAAVKKMGRDWKVMAIAGDGGTFDIGLQSLSGTLERGQNVTHICLDNEAYMNTGIQRSGATPYGAWTTTSPPGEFSIGKHRQKKPIAEIVAAHRVPYVATASIAYPADLIGKIKKAFERQPSFVHIHCPCPTGWKYESSQTVQLAKKAVETGMWILYEIEDGKLRITKRVEEDDRLPVGDYLKLQARFKHLKPESPESEELKTIQKHINTEWERLEKIESSGIVY
jgi:pyruvate ferredoxin oxidoreductase beta subunit